MAFAPGLKIGQIIKNADLVEIGWQRQKSLDVPYSSGS